MKHYKMLKLFLLPTILAGNILCSCNFDKQKFKDDFSKIVDEMDTKEPSGLKSDSPLEDIVIEVGDGNHADEPEETQPEPEPKPEPEPEPEPVAREKFTVTFVMGEMEITREFEEGAEIIYPEPEEIEHYHFVEWDQDIATMPNEPIRIVAVYEINKHMLTFDLGYGNIQEEEVEYGAEIVYPEDPTNEDNIFLGWDKEITTMPDEPVTITAQWRELIKGNISFTNDQGEEEVLTWEEMIEREIVTTGMQNNKYTLKAIDTTGIDLHDGVLIIDEGIEGIGSLGSCNTGGIKKVIVPDSVTYLNSGPFANYPDLEEVVLGSGITKISSGCFRNSTNFKRVNMNYITRIEDSAFWNSGIEEFTLSSQLEYVGTNAFLSCTQLTEVTIDTNAFSSPGYQFKHDTNLRKVHAGPNFKTVAGEMFMNCISLELDFIEQIENFDASAFAVDCTAYPDYELEYILIPASVKQFNGTSFGKNGTFKYPVYVNQDEKFLYNNTYTSNGYAAFAKATEVYFLDPNGDVELNGNTYSTISEIKVPREVSKIGRYLFYGLTSVTDIYIPREVTTICGEIFSGRSSGSINVHYEGSEEEWEAIPKTEKVGRKTLNNTALNTSNIEFNTILDY